ncbi:hypothetical protein CEE44_04715 [Candidatus Woesearchaeota archaeon B3_Woes]|nr:MAG: hypothetical protein CEE44_04715 [Candidatus Woesearchaeota archaeon B3_Woes]
MKPYKINNVKKIAIKSPYFRFAARETCISRDEPWIWWLVNRGCKGFIDMPNKNIYDYYIEEKSSLETLSRLARYMEKNWKKHFLSYDKRKKRLIQKAIKLSKSTKTNNKKIILKNYLDYVDESCDYSEYIWSAWAVIHFTEKDVLKNFPDKIELVMALDKPIDFINMQRALHRLSPKELVKKWGWLKIYSGYDKEYTEEYFERQRKNISKEEIEEQFKRFKEVKKEFSEFLKSIKDKKLRLKTEIVHTYAFMKTERIDVWKRATFHLKGFFRYLTTLEKGLTLKDVTNLTMKETKGVLEKGKFPDKKELKLRGANKALYYFQKGMVDMMYDMREINKTLDRLQGELKNITTLEGMTACKGKVKGRVKIITHSDHLKKIKKGDIFVAKYTFPNFTPKMIISAAVITDEGGITSHAAIVSREYNIPCVIGTKVATNVLKDNDLVEVDADKGVVKKIN